MKKNKPNILFIPIDDLRPQLNCYGQHQMVTPNIDKLAADGVLFSRPYCQVPVCGATRASLLTGVRPTRERFVTYYTMADHDLPGALTLPQHFRNNGYETVSVGKVFHHREDTAERSWSTEPWHPSAQPGESWRNYLLEENRAADRAETHCGPPYECIDVSDEAYYDGQIARRGVDEMRRLCQGDAPWFLAAGFVKPHLPFNAPKRYWDRYRRDGIDLAGNPFAPQGAPPEAMHNWGELRQYFDVPAEGPLPDEMARTLIHGYYAATSYTDAQVGLLVQELDRLGERENTVVVLWGDHGWQLGEHGLWCKHCNFNTSLWSPLIVSAPWMGAEKRCDALVEFVDIYPTLCEFAGLPKPGHLEGTSFLPLMDDPQRDWKRAVFSRYFAGDSIRTDRYLYTEWTDDAGSVTARMLYDHQTDSDENVNLAADAACAERVRELGTALAEGWGSSKVWG